MGCDIHPFAEFGTGRRIAYDALSDGEFLLPRDYDLFAALAGVRAEPGFVPLHPPRGIPTNVSQHVADRYFVPVLDDARAAAWGVGEHFTPDEAAQLVVAGQAHRPWDGMTPPLLPSTDGHVSHPDWHTPSWLEIAELHAALAHAGYDLASASAEFQLLVQYLDAVAARMGPSTRLVFWFDN